MLISEPNLSASSLRLTLRYRHVFSSLVIQHECFLINKLSDLTYSITSGKIVLLIFFFENRKTSFS